MDRKVVLIAGIIIVLLAGISSYFFFFRGGAGAPVKQEEIKEKPVKTLSASDVGMTIEAGIDKKTVLMEIAKLEGILSFDYEVSYSAQTEEGDAPRGVIGTLEVKPSDKLIKKEITLGTCSRNVCKYDKGVKEVDFVVKVNFTNGDIGSIQQKITL